MDVCLWIRDIQDVASVNCRLVCRNKLPNPLSENKKSNGIPESSRSGTHRFHRTSHALQKTDEREVCSTSPVLFNIYHSTAMRTGTERRMHRNNFLSGIKWLWSPGCSFPPQDLKRASGSIAMKKKRAQIFFC